VVFGMGPRGPDDQAWQRSRDQLDRALAKHGWLNPVAIALFGGADPPKAKRARRDQRDWQRIETWASTIADPAGWPVAAADPGARGVAR
jgi:menaquinone-dependent protoporphyrinogen oxidase